MSEQENSNDTTETVKLSLREELDQRLKAPAESVEEVVEEVVAEEIPSEDVTEEVAAEVAEEDEVSTEPELKKDDLEDFPELPNHWTDDEKQAFMDIPDEIVAQDGTEISLKEMKSVVNKRYDDLLKAFNKKARNSSEAVKDNSEWNKLVDPYKPQLQAAGMSPHQWIGSILQGVHNLQQNPKAVIRELVGTYKVSASDLGFKTEQSEEEDYLHGEDSPKVAQLETTVDTLRAELNSFKNASVLKENESIQSQLAAFKDEKDSNGNLMHPHFEEARNEMSYYMNSGQARTLQEAYTMSPTVKGKSLNAKDPKDEKLALKKAREEAAKAKKAGKTVKTRSGKTNSFKDTSLREELRLRMSSS